MYTKMRLLLTSIFASQLVHIHALPDPSPELGIPWAHMHMEVCDLDTLSCCKDHILGHWWADKLERGEVTEDIPFPAFSHNVKVDPVTRKASFECMDDRDAPLPENEMQRYIGPYTMTCPEGELPKMSFGPRRVIRVRNYLTLLQPEPHPVEIRFWKVVWQETATCEVMDPEVIRIEYNPKRFINPDEKRSMHSLTNLWITRPGEDGRPVKDSWWATFSIPGLRPGSGSKQYSDGLAEGVVPTAGFGMVCHDFKFTASFQYN